MVLSANTELVRSLQRALADALVLARGGTFTTVEQFADAATALPAMRTADDDALAAATADGYALATPPPDGKPLPVRPAGRALDARCLVDTGVAGLLLEGPEPGLDIVATRLAAYLAGPNIDLFDFAVLDLDLLPLDTPVDVADGWQLVTPTADELQAALPVPAAARHAQLGWNPAFCAGMAMLRRVNPEHEPVRSFLISFDVDPAHRLWKPLLALSLYANPVVHLWARYVVEPGRHVARLFEHYTTRAVTVDGEVWDEVPDLGDFQVEAADRPRFTRFLGAVAPLIEQSQPPGTGKKSAVRLRRATEHFLTAGENAHGEGDVLSERNAETVLHYVIALEALLAGTDADRLDLTRKVAQRAAVLAGDDDTHRLEVHDFVRRAYGVRSVFAHGGEPEEIATATLRSIVRRCLTARLVLGDPPSERTSLAVLADEALLSQTTLRTRVTEQLAAFAANWETA